MTEVTGLTKPSNMPGCPIIGGTPSVGQEGMLLADGPHLPTDRPSSWPFKREEHSALAWWRTLPWIDPRRRSPAPARDAPPDQRPPWR